MKNKVIKKEKTWLSKGIYVFFILTIGLLVAKIFVSNQLATTGATASADSERIRTLRAENQALQNEVSRLGSIAYISSQASHLGMKRVTKIEVLPSISSVAFNR